MKLTASVLAACVPAISARFIEQGEGDNVVLFPQIAEGETYLVETSPGETKWVTEEEKWEMRRNGQNFIDITNYPESSAERFATETPVVFPKKCTQQSEVNKLADKLATKPMEDDLTKLTSFHTRYYKSTTGLEASDWILERVQKDIEDNSAGETVSVQPFPHTWQQHSVIASIPGQTNNTVVVGAHLDSINLWLPSVFAAPGADDDGSGTVTIMEVFRTLLQDEAVRNGEALNTVEFHWYSAEEGGLLGSQAIFQQYAEKNRVIKAMLQQDMTGYVQKTLDAGQPESVGVIMDYVNPGLTGFIKTVIEEYCDIPWVETKCGYACSDHASASKAGYPSAFVIESAFENSNDKIHTTSDQIQYLSFDHMLQHARMTLGLVYELAHFDFDA